MSLRFNALCITKPSLCLRRVALAAAAALMAPAAHASIVFTPASIVDHGSYITDTVNHLDWYKFSNAATTVGQSYDASMAQFGALGWASAGLAQVQGLQAQFGWLADTFDFSQNANFGLTLAMGAYLGDTVDDVFAPDATQILRTLAIRAMTWDAFCVDGDCEQVTTDSETRSIITLVDGQNVVTNLGDFVEGSSAYQPEGIALDGVGTWLVRNSVNNDGCSPLAPIPCDGSTVPEPHSLALVLLALGGAFVSRRARD